MYAARGATAPDAPHLDLLRLCFSLDGMHHAISLAIIRSNWALAAHSRLAVANGISCDMVYASADWGRFSFVAAPAAHASCLYTNKPGYRIARVSGPEYVYGLSQRRRTEAADP